MVFTSNGAGASIDGDASADGASPNSDADARRADAASGGDSPNTGDDASAADANDDDAIAPAPHARDRYPPGSRPPAPAQARDRAEMQPAESAQRAARLLLQLRASPCPPARRRRSSGSLGVACLPPLRFAKAQTSRKANERKLNRHTRDATIFGSDRCVLDFYISVTGLHQLHRLATRPNQGREIS